MDRVENQRKLQDLVDDLPRFTQALSALAARLQLDMAQFNADHVSLHCRQLSTAQRWHQGLLRCGVLFSEKEINGRPICLFNLHHPLAIGPWQISCVELPYPGKKRYPHEGWEHVEWVIAGGHEDFYSRALAYLTDEALQLPGIKLKCSTPQGEGERFPNPTLAVTDGNVTIKFHPYTLQQITGSEY